MRIKHCFAGLLLLTLLGGCVVTPVGYRYSDGYREYDRYRTYDNRDGWGRGNRGGWSHGDRGYWNDYHREQR